MKALKRLAVFPKRQDPEYIEYHYHRIRPGLVAAAQCASHPVEITQFFYMLAKLRRNDEELVAKLTSAAQAQVERLDPFGCSNILWSLATLGCSKTSAARYLAAALQQRFVARVADANAKDCSTFILSSAKLGMGSPD